MILVFESDDERKQAQALVRSVLDKVRAMSPEEALAYLRPTQEETAKRVAEIERLRNEVVMRSFALRGERRGVGLYTNDRTGEQEIREVRFFLTQDRTYDRMDYETANILALDGRILRDRWQSH